MTPLEEIQAARQALENDAELRRYMPGPITALVSAELYERLEAEGLPMEGFTAVAGIIHTKTNQ